MVGSQVISSLLSTVIYNDWLTGYLKFTVDSYIQ